MVAALRPAVRRADGHRVRQRRQDFVSSSPPEAVAASWSRRPWRVALASGAVVAYVAIQVQVERLDWAVSLRHQYAHGVPRDSAAIVQHAPWITVVLQQQFLLFASLALGTALLARRGHRWFALPIALWVAPAFVGANGSRFAPQPLGNAWSSGFHFDNVGWLSTGAILDVGLCAAVGFAAWRSAGARSLRGRRSCAASAAVVAAVVLLVAAAPHFYGQPEFPLTTIALQLGALAIIAAGAAPYRASTVAVLALIPIGLAAGTNGLSEPLSYLAWRDLARNSHDVWIPYAIVVIAGALWLPLARLVARLELRPRRVAIACNGLNLADAGFTWAFVSHGLATESNPIVATAGLLAKIVAVASWLLARHRPAALVWLSVVLAAVLGWHLLGWAASSGFAWWL